MFIKLLIAFATIPLVELALLIKIGQYIGILPTIVIVASTGVIGITLAKNQGYQVISRIKMNIEQGRMPADDLIGGVLILLGGTMLLTPGVITDISGFSLIIPTSRKMIAKYVKKKIRKYIGNSYQEV